MSKLVLLESVFHVGPSNIEYYILVILFAVDTIQGRPCAAILLRPTLQSTVIVNLKLFQGNNLLYIHISSLIHDLHNIHWKNRYTQLTLDMWKNHKILGKSRIRLLVVAENSLQS